MAEENEDKFIAPENMKLGSGDVNVVFQANKKTVGFDDMEVETGNIMIDVKPTTIETSDSNMYQRRLEPGIVGIVGIVDEGETKQWKESNGSSTKEEGDYWKGNSDHQGNIHVQNSSTEEIDIASSHPRKKSDLVIVGSNQKFNVHSRYLSDSVGSCHDFCKSGHKHQSEMRVRKPRLGTIRQSQPLIKKACDDLGNCVLEKATKKKELLRPLSLPSLTSEEDSLRHLEDKDLPKDINRSKMKKHLQSGRTSSLVQSPKTPCGSKTSIQAVKKAVFKSQNLQKNSTDILKEIKTCKVVGSFSEAEMKGPKKKPEYTFSEISFSKKADVQGVIEINRKETMSRSPTTSRNKAVGYSKGLKKMKAKDLMGNSPKTMLNKAPSMKDFLFKNRKISSNSQNQINLSESEIDGHDDIVEPNANMESTKGFSNATISGEKSQHSPLEARGIEPQGSKGNRKGIEANLLSFSSRVSFKFHGEKHDLAMTNNKQTGFKTEESESKNNTPTSRSALTLSLKNSNSKNTKDNDAIREDSHFRISTPRQKAFSTSSTPKENSTVEQNWTLERKEKSNDEEKVASAWKVKFKRGSFVALQAANNAPKRLRFRRARIFGEDQVAEAEIELKLHKEHDMDSNDRHDKVENEKVRLRHQEVSEKKDDVDLNNVIEETASMLVKTRKSKVKALVGAFETLISRGDHKRLVET